MKNLFGKLLCWLGFHDSVILWDDDGHGNSGAYDYCRRCRKVWHDYGF